MKFFLLIIFSAVLSGCATPQSDQKFDSQSDSQSKFQSDYTRIRNRLADGSGFYNKSETEIIVVFYVPKPDGSGPSDILLIHVNNGNTATDYLSKNKGGVVDLVMEGSSVADSKITARLPKESDQQEFKRVINIIANSLE